MSAASPAARAVPPPEPPPPDLPRMPSGVPGLDIVLNGGFLQSGLYIVQGPPGTGKTTLGNQVCFNHVAGGGKALYITLLAEYHGRMMQHLSTMSFYDDSRMPDQLAYLNGLGILHEDGLKGLLALLRREITARGASLLVLDGIVAARRVAADEQAFNQFVHELQAVAISAECTVFMLTSVQGNIVTPEHTMVDGIIELCDELTGWAAESSLQVVKFRGSSFLRGRHAFKITNQGIIVYPRTEALLLRPSVPDPCATGSISSGIAQLDRMLKGGLPAASTTMALGPSGTGKTTMGLQFLAAGGAAEPGLLFGFYETPERIAAKAKAVCPALVPLLQDGRVQMLWQPPAADLLDAYGEALLRSVRERGVRRLFIDGLDAFQRACGSEPERINNFLVALMNEMRVLGVTTLYTLEVPDIMGPTIRTPIGNLSSLAENLILLRFVELGAHLHRLISILKVRDSQFDASLHEYHTSAAGLIIEPDSTTAQRITAGFSTRSTDAQFAAAAQPPAGTGG